MPTKPPVAMNVPTPVRQMELRGVRVHNLKNLDLDIPLGCLVALSGVSGSGKSSLAFDTLYSEGQRRYIESFSIAARQHLERIDRPDADRISHIPPAIAIRSDGGRRRRSDERMTVGTVADVLDGFRMLFARAGRIVCPDCALEVQAHSAADVVVAVSGLPAGTRCQPGFDVDDRTESDPGSTWLARGFSRAIWNGATHDLSTKPAWPKSGIVRLVVDRLIAGKSSPERQRESAETALREGGGKCWLLVEVPDGKTERGPTAGTDATVPVHRDDIQTIDGRTWATLKFNRRLVCARCDREFLPLEPRLFSHLASGACLKCRGTGRHTDERESSPTTARDTSKTGPGNSAESRQSKCIDCNGTRFREESRAVQIANRSIADLCGISPSAARSFVHDIEGSLTESEKRQTELIRADILQRLTAVCDLGLDYLTLDRAAATLSGGETRRLMLAALIGSRITGTLVVVDEPSAGLSEKELPLVISALRRVQSLRNSVIAVEHSPIVVAAADHIIELGPGAGPSGGNIVYQGTPLDWPGRRSSDTGGSLVSPTRCTRRQDASGEEQSPLVERESPSDAPRLRLTQIRHRNFDHFEVDFPIGQLCVVTGPGGSGKTTLVTGVLYPALCRQLGLPCEISYAGSCKLSGAEKFVDALLIDQSPLTRSARSNPATWLEVFDEIRQTFATTMDAKQRGLTARHFSFNSSAGGRCRSCLGTGFLKHDMQFLPDVSLVCPECNGTRFRREILEVKYRGRSIADVLSMSASDAAVFFRSQPRIQHRFQLLKQIGLDYLVLGQSSDSLSGGEARRLKLAARLAAPARGPCLIVCDEPTAGLHSADVARLTDCFRELIANGNSLVLADNSPDLLAAADVVIELGD